MTEIAAPDREIVVTPEDVEQCWRFAETAWNMQSQSQKQYGTDIQRTREDFIADQVEGKLTEIAMQRFFAGMGLKVEPNFTHYLDPHQLDDGDIDRIEVNGAWIKPTVRLDAKGTTRRARWLLVEEHKFTSDFYLLIRFLDLPRKGDARANPEILRGKRYHAEAVGWADKHAFRCPETGYFWFVYERDDRPLNPDCLPDKPPESLQALRDHIKSAGPTYMNVTLDAYINYGLPDTWLRTDWAELVRSLRASVAVPTLPPTLPSAVPQPITTPARLPAPVSALANAIAGAAPRYSLTLLAGTRPVTPDIISTLMHLLRQGIKIVVAAQRLAITPEMEPYLEARLLQLFSPAGDACQMPAEPALVVDGQGADAVKPLLEDVEAAWRPAWPKGRSFNAKQYLIEHAAAGEHLCIRAGAGAGKTTVMVQRVLFLLHTVPDLSPGEILMITFTRDAAHEMRSRLRQALVDRYRLATARRDWYLALLEQLGKMPIKTIHAFARQLLKALGSTDGLGQSMAVKEFRRERRQIIEQVIDERLDRNRLVQHQLQLPVYEFVRIADKYWNEIENKGLSSEEIERLDWGQAPAGPAAEIQAVLAPLFPEAERRLKALKDRANAISLKDLNRRLDQIRGRVADLQRHLDSAIKFVFVDEFQDTDDTQIRLVAWLQRELRPRPSLFVVGDVKQAIYRFRGATEASFDALAGQLPDDAPLQTRWLNRNYRSDVNLLDDMDQRFFLRWGREGKLLYDPAKQDGDRLVGDKPGGDRVVVQPADGRAEDLEDAVLRLIRDALKKLPAPAHEADAPAQAAVLVRTNRQALLIRQWCEEQAIPCQIETGGDFYLTPPVTDLLHLVTALLFPDDAAAQLNLHQSPYSAMGVPWQAMTDVPGNSARIVADLERHPPMAGWQQYREKLREWPVLSVIRQIIRGAQPAQRVFQAERERLLALGMKQPDALGAAERTAVRYSRNLNKLMQLLREQFASESVTLHTIYEFLTLKRATDREEDQVPLTDAEKQVRLLCKTVYKAKGQEFHTVLIPFTTHGFLSSRSELLLRQVADASGNVGWQAAWQMAQHRNQLFARLRPDEDKLVRHEETRLLYVAMTRAQKRLWIIQDSWRTDCWSHLLRG